MIFRHAHHYEAVAVQHSSAGAFAPTGTVILWRCKCAAVFSDRIMGKWTLAQVRDEPYLIGADETEAGDPLVKAQG